MRELNVESNRSVERTILIVNSFGFDQPDLTIEEIVKQTGLPKTTVYRILWSMEKHGLIQYDERKGRYRLGYKLLEYGGIVLQHLDIRREAEPFLSELYERTGFTVLLAMRQEETLQYILRFESDDGFQPQSFLGRRRILHYGVIGRMLLAHMPVSEVTDLLGRHPIEQCTPDTIVEQPAIYEQLKRMREDGYGLDVGGTFPGFTGLSVPVFGLHGDVKAAIGVAAPTFKLQDDEILQQVIEWTRNSAKQISLRLGHVETRRGPRD